MAGLDHEVHELVRQDHTARYGCLNTPAAKAGYHLRVRKYVGNTYTYEDEFIPDRFSKTCRYDLSHKDPKCEGCVSVGMGKFYDEDIRSRGT